MAPRSVTCALGLCGCLVLGAGILAQSGRGFPAPPDGSSAGALAFVWSLAALVRRAARPS